MSVRVTKPSIPSTIVANFKAMEEERTKELIAQARERVVTREAEIERTRAIMQVCTTMPISLHCHRMQRLAHQSWRCTACKALHRT